MSVYASAYVWEHSRQKGSALLLLLAIADIADKTGRAHPGVATLARYTRMSKRQTIRLLHELQASGELLIGRGAAARGTHVLQLVMNENLPLFDEDSRTIPPVGKSPAAVDKPGDILTGVNLTGDKSGARLVTFGAPTGDIAVSPEPRTKYLTGPRRDPGRGKATPPAPGSAPRPTIVCSDCGHPTYTWTGSRCDPCWRAYMNPAGKRGLVKARA